MIGDPSRLRLIRKAAALARIFPHFDFSLCPIFFEFPFFFLKEEGEVCISSSTIAPSPSFLIPLLTAGGSNGETRPTS